MAGPIGTDTGLLSITYDPASLGRLAQLPGFTQALEMRLAEAFPDIGTMLVEDMQTMTQIAFVAPTGQLADSIVPMQETPLTLVIEVNVPYAWRMEMGFTGTDSIGRVYDQEAEPYAEPTLQEDADRVIQALNLAAAQALADIGAVE